MELNETDLKEIFALFTSATLTEKKQIYDKDSDHYLGKVDLNKEYELNMQIRDYSLDAWRAVITFLYNRGYKLMNKDKVIVLDFILSEYVDA